VAPQLPAAKQVRRDERIIADRARGLRWATIAERHGLSEVGRIRNYYWNAPRGIVVAETPDARTVLPKGSRIDLVISRGRK
jgi:hypothetical protein